MINKATHFFINFNEYLLEQDSNFKFNFNNI